MAVAGSFEIGSQLSGRIAIVNTPKLHHFVPQFYMNNFSFDRSKVWVWDKSEDRIFVSSSKNLAAETNFYLLNEINFEGEIDAYEMEKQFSIVESDTSKILTLLISAVQQMQLGESFQLSEVEKENFAHYITLQFLRTADTRDTLKRLASADDTTPITDSRLRALHIDLLWDDKLVSSFVKHWKRSIWIVAKNNTKLKFITSDNPVCFRTADNAMWLKAGMLSKGTYLAFPLTPELILYIYPDHKKWAGLRKFDCHISPVHLTEGMVQSENTGQVFMATRFLIADNPGFYDLKEFKSTIGTNIYARL